MIDPEDVTPGYWYVLRNVSWLENDEQSLYEIVDVTKDGFLKYCGVDEHLSCDKHHPSIFFIAPVPNPIGKSEETIKELKEELNLPSTANTADVFRAALALARETSKALKEEERE